MLSRSLSFVVFFDYLLCLLILCFIFFFFKQKTAYEMRISDWSSDVCSSDLCGIFGRGDGDLDRCLAMRDEIVRQQAVGGDEYPGDDQEHADQHRRVQDRKSVV